MVANFAVATSQAVDLRQERNLLGRFEQDLDRAGLVGEKQNAKIVLLAAASAKLEAPLNVSVGGSSSAGKNQLIGTVARFIPACDQKFLTGMSPKALMHAAEDEFEHKAVFIAEHEGVANADYPIRTMQSEKMIAWDYVDSSKDGLTKKTKRVKGPAAFIQATTRATLHPENETRLLFVQMDESEEQTRAINKRQAQRAERKVEECPSEVFKAWHDLLGGLRPAEVRIPYATQLAQALPGRVRSRRDLPKLLGLIEASAYLHQHKRQKDVRGYVVATPEDYQIAKALFEHSYYAGPESKVGELLKAAEQLKLPQFTVADLVQGTGWGKSKVYEVLSRAEELGNLVDGERRGLYKLVHTRPETPLTLPAKVKLFASDFRISTGTPSVVEFDDSSLLEQAAILECSSGKAEEQIALASS